MLFTDESLLMQMYKCISQLKYSARSALWLLYNNKNLQKSVRESLQDKKANE